MAEPQQRAFLRGLKLSEEEEFFDFACNSTVNWGSSKSSSSSSSKGSSTSSGKGSINSSSESSSESNGSAYALELAYQSHKQQQQQQQRQQQQHQQNAGYVLPANELTPQLFVLRHRLCCRRATDVMIPWDHELPNTTNDTKQQQEQQQQQ
ncbi:hypothetical protein Emag_005081 [Eimeria magna]